MCDFCVECDNDAAEPLVMNPGRIESVRDLVEEKLDEMADICEHWKRNRDKGYAPNAIRAALLMLSEEIVLLSKLKP